MSAPELPNPVLTVEQAIGRGGKWFIVEHYFGKRRLIGAVFGYPDYETAAETARKMRS